MLALLPNAYQQGYTAGVNMAGGEASFDCAIPMNAVGFSGLHIITAGVTTGEARVTASDGSYKALFTADGLLKGFILVGDVARAGIYTRLILRAGVAGYHRLRSDCRASPADGLCGG